MDAVLAALADQQEELSSLIDPLDEAGWSRPSRCEGWAVADVVLHLAQTNEMAVGSAQDRFAEALTELTRGMTSAVSVDDGAALMVDHQRGGSGTEVRDRWRTSAADLRRALEARDPHDRVAWVAGELSVHTLATTRLAETWIHTGDVAAGLDHELAPTDRLWHIARLAWRTLPYAFGRDGRQLEGPVAFALASPSGDEWTFTPDDPPLTTVTGNAVDLCLVAARRVDPRHTSLRTEGPDGVAVLDLIRTYA